MAPSRRALAALTLASSVLAQLPPYKQTWQLNESTIIMPCNYSGYTDPQSTAGWKYIDFE